MSSALRERVKPGLLPSSATPLTGIQIGSAIYLLVDGRVVWIPINRAAVAHSGAHHYRTASTFHNISHLTNNQED
jgi:hypothetical protein